MWRGLYRGTRFPPLLVVVDGVDRAGLARRTDLLHRVATALPRPRYEDLSLRLAVTSLELLREQGPRAAVWTRVGHYRPGEVVGLTAFARRR
ncbi:hypothetical protein GXW82_44655 [Streptacidiphilus sp. 4-A2]|nr:hypothetical protein [Streptacidiphilus sp. 4-A2]